METEHQVEQEIRRAATPLGHKKSHGKFIALLVVLGILLAAGVTTGVLKRQTHDRALASSADDDAGRAPVVNVGHVRQAGAKSTIELPGDLVARVETPMYARIDGYLKTRPVEIGDRVKKGDLLVEIDTPDLDAQIAQSQATLAQSKATLQQLNAALAVAKSNAKLADLTAERYKLLLAKDAIAKQDYDDRAAQAEVAEANVKQAEENINAAQSMISANAANVQRMKELKIYTRLLAPFDGVVTYRSERSDPGTLISAGNTTQSRELIKVSQIDTLRIFVNVPQSYSTLIHDGQTAELTVDEFPGRTFPAKVRGTTNAVDPATRSLLAVLLVNNSKGELLPGMYAKVRFALPHMVSVMMLPADALVLKTDGPQAAVVGADHKIHFHKLIVGRDMGAELEVNAGLEEGDAVVLNPTDAIREGVTVEVKERAGK
ncbi:MAG TPA: efflux RND transporter periplasmic adaptor subunit [Bryobacteraceae bacterium]|jgi:RND family efflux transporter MFP subunit|nr:efflux RND transporter periplasmic adaptor subunit [Bryobacteraceae bacterium]